MASNQSHISPDLVMARAGQRLEILLSDFDVSVRVVSHSVSDGEAFRAQELDLPTINNTDSVGRLEAVVASLPGDFKSSVDELILFVADAEVELYDNRSAKPLQGTHGQILEFASDTICRPEAAYCSLKFGQSSEREEPRLLYALVDADKIRSYLMALGSLSLKTKIISPVMSHLLAKEQADESGVVAVFDMRAENSSITLSNCVSGAVYSRSLGIGWNDLIAACCHILGQSVENVKKMLLEEEGLIVQLIEEGRTLKNSVDANEMYTDENPSVDIFRRMADEILLAIEFFAFQRMAGVPRGIIVTGAAADSFAIQGLIRNCRDFELPMRAIPYEEICFMDAASVEDSNFLSGAPRELVRFDGQAFEFVGGNFRVIRQAPRPSKRREASSDVQRLLFSAKDMWCTCTQQQRRSAYALLCVSLLFALFLSVGQFFTSNALSAYHGIFSQALSQSAAVSVNAHGITGSIGVANEQSAAADLSSFARAVPVGMMLDAVTKFDRDGVNAFQISGSVDALEKHTRKVAQFIQSLEADVGLGLGDNSVTLIESHRPIGQEPARFILEVVGE